MNEPGNEPQNPSRPVDSADTVESLRRQMNLLFGGLIITSFTATIYLGLEARRVTLDLPIAQQRASEITKLSQQDAGSMQPIVVKLSEFARAHPDFQKQIFFKYRFNTNAPAPAANK